MQSEPAAAALDTTEPELSPARGRSFTTDVALLTGVRFVSVGAAFLTSVVAARLLGPADLGAGAVVIALATISALIANGGLGISVIYFIGRRPADRDVIVDNVVAMAVAAVVVAAALVLVTIPLTLEWLLPGHSALVLVAGAFAAAGMVSADVGGAVLLGLHARGRFMVVEAIRTIATLVATAAILFAVIRSEVGYVLATAVALSVAGAVAYAGITRIRGRVRLHLDRPFVRESLAMGIPGQAGNLLQYLNLRLDLLLVSALLDVQAAGIYLVAVRAAEVVVQVANAVSALLFPRVAARTEHGETAPTERAVRVTLAVVGASAIGLGLLAGPILSLAFGERFAAGTTVLQLSLVAMVPLALSRILTGDLKGRGRADVVSVANLFALVLTAASGVTLIPMLGIEGAALSSVITYVGLAVVLLLAYVRVAQGRLRDLVPRPSDVGMALGMARRALR